MSSRPDGAEEPGRTQVNALGTFIRVQRQLARMSLREMAALTSVSNAYLSQIERGLHQPSLRVLRSIAQALSIAPEELLRRANFLSASDGAAEARATDPDTGQAGGADAGPAVGARTAAQAAGARKAAQAGGADTGQAAIGADAGWVAGHDTGRDTEAAIAADPKLTPRQREALLNVYRSFRDSG